MALLTCRARVNYEAQHGMLPMIRSGIDLLLISREAAFEDFFRSFKASASHNEVSAANALEDLHINEDGLSDDYDFMEDAADGNGFTRSTYRGAQDRNPKLKYMEMLQKVADRQTSEVCIELDDLDAVSIAEDCGRILLMLGQYENSLGDDAALKLVESVECNAKHYVDIISQAVDKVMPKETQEISYVSSE